VLVAGLLGDVQECACHFTEELRADITEAEKALAA
jgi:hypothetical protein